MLEIAFYFDLSPLNLHHFSEKSQFILSNHVNSFTLF